MTTRERLKQWIDGLDEQELERILLIVEESVGPVSGRTGTSTSKTTGTEEVGSHDSRYDGPLGELIRFGDSLNLPDDGITDVSVRHDEYLAEIYESEWKR